MATNKYLIGLLLSLNIISSKISQACEVNVDSLTTYYINGMLTEEADYYVNRSGISGYLLYDVSKNLGINIDIQGTYNRNEFILFQLIEVAYQKYQDYKSISVIQDFLSGKYDRISSNNEDIIRGFLSEVSDKYSEIHAESETKEAINNISDLLDTCQRVIVLTHSQGNFYGNAVINSIYETYYYPNGYPLLKYPMLGTLQVASPVYVPGAGVSTIHSDMIGHITNDTDVIMSAVRNTVGSVEANFDADENPNDSSGHGIIASYLEPIHQRSYMQQEFTRIIKSMIPYPLHKQIPITSSAITGGGYTHLNTLLDIQFSDASVYRYKNVPEKIFFDLVTASSIGRYFNQNIRGKFETELIIDVVAQE